MHEAAPAPDVRGALSFTTAFAIEMPMTWQWDVSHETE